MMEKLYCQNIKKVVLDNMRKRKLFNLIIRKELENEPDKIVTIVRNFYCYPKK